MTPPRPISRPPRADYPDRDGDTIVLYVPDTEDNRPRVLDATGRQWRRQIGFSPSDKEPR